MLSTNVCDFSAYKRLHPEREEEKNIYSLESGSPFPKKTRSEHDKGFRDFLEVQKVIVLQVCQNEVVLKRVVIIALSSLCGYVSFDGNDFPRFRNIMKYAK